MERKRSKLTTIFALSAIILGLLGAYIIVSFIMMATVWAKIHGAESAFSVSMLIYICTIPLTYLLLAIIGIGIFRLNRWWWEFSVRVMPIYLVCIILLHIVISIDFKYGYINFEWGGLLQKLLFLSPFTVFGVMLTIFLTRPKVKEQFK